MAQLNGPIVNQQQACMVYTYTQDSVLLRTTLRLTLLVKRIDNDYNTYKINPQAPYSIQCPNDVNLKTGSVAYDIRPIAVGAYLTIASASKVLQHNSAGHYGSITFEGVLDLSGTSVGTLRTNVGTLVVPDIAVTPTVFDYHLTATPVLEFHQTALNKMLFTVSNIQKNVAFDVELRVMFNGQIKVGYPTADLGSVEVQLTQLAYTGAYTIQVWGTRNAEVLHTFTGTITTAGIIIDHSIEYRDNLTQNSCTIVIPDVVFELTNPHFGDVPYTPVLAITGTVTAEHYGYWGVSDGDNPVCAEFTNLLLTGDSIQIPVLNWDFFEYLLMDFTWYADGLVADTRSSELDSTVPEVGVDSIVGITDITPTGFTVTVSNALCTYEPNWYEWDPVFEINPDDVTDWDVEFPYPINIRWVTVIREKSTNMVYTKLVQDTLEPSLVQVVTGLKPNTLYEVTVYPVAMSRAINTEIGYSWVYGPEPVDATTGAFTIYSIDTWESIVSASYCRSFARSIWTQMNAITGNGDFDIYFKVYQNDVVKYTTEVIPINTTEPKYFAFYWAILNPSTTYALKIECYEASTDYLIRTIGPWNKATIANRANTDVEWYGTADQSYAMFNGFPETRWVFPAREMSLKIDLTRNPTLAVIRVIFTEQVREYHPIGTSYDAKWISRDCISREYTPDENGYVIIDDEITASKFLGDVLLLDADRNLIRLVSGDLLAFFGQD